MNKRLIIIPLINLAVATLVGVLLRYVQAGSSLPVKFNFFLHAHSHVAFLGWVYMALFLLLIHLFLSPEQQKSKEFNIQFWLSQISVTGMLVTFPIQGYALFSIIFSTAHIFISYWFAISFYRKLKNVKIYKSHLSIRFVLAGIFFMALSSIGPFALAVIMANKLNNTPWYYNSIYFYLHFQYNGWFTFGILGILLRLMELKFPELSLNRNLKNVFLIIFISTFPLYLISTFWNKPDISIYIIGFLSAIAQVLGLWLLYKQVKQPLHKFIAESYTSKILIYTSLICLILKSALQVFSPFYDMLQIRNAIIGYLHLTLIGFISFGMIWILFRENWLQLKRAGLVTVILLVAGFIITEIILFASILLMKSGGDFYLYYSKILLFGSIILCSGFCILPFCVGKKSII